MADLTGDEVNVRPIPLQEAWVAIGNYTPRTRVPFEFCLHSILLGVLCMGPAQPAHTPFHIIV